MQDLNRIHVKDFWQEHTTPHEIRKWQPIQWWQQFTLNNAIQNLQQELSHRQIRAHPGPDKLRWGYRMEGNFSIKEAFHLARGPPAANPDPFWKKLWEAKLWPKITLFLWLVIRGRVLTWDNLQKRGFTGPSQCVLCCQNSEDMRHILDSCPMALDLWDRGATLFHRSDRKHSSPQDTIRS